MIGIAEKKIKKMIRVTGILFMSTIIAQPGIMAYAGPATDTATVEQRNQTIVTYTQSQVATLGNWEQQTDGTWRFKQFTGDYLISAWLESQTEAGCWYFVDNFGTMLTSTTTPDGYSVNENGEWRQVPNNIDTSVQQSATSQAFQELSWEEFAKLTETELIQYVKAFSDSSKMSDKELNDYFDDRHPNYYIRIGSDLFTGTKHSCILAPRNIVSAPDEYYVKLFH